MHLYIVKREEVEKAMNNYLVQETLGESVCKHKHKNNGDFGGFNGQFCVYHGFLDGAFFDKICFIYELYFYSSKLLAPTFLLQLSHLALPCNDFRYLNNVFSFV